MTDIPSTKAEAVKRMSTYYFTGKPCANGHVDKRYTNTDICYECKRLQARRDYANHKERTRVINGRSRKKNMDKVLANSRFWCAKNREKSNAIKKSWKVRHRDSYLQRARQYARTKRLDPIYRLSSNISLGMWRSLKYDKAGRHWETLVGYTIWDLKKHLESKFTPEMNWKNYGPYWEVDHIKPKSLCASFAECWNLQNLQPLETSKNRSKGNRFIG